MYVIFILYLQFSALADKIYPNTSVHKAHVYILPVKLDHLDTALQD